jgi:hypothetical protein
VKAWDWITVIVHGLGAAIEAGVSAGRAKREQLTGQAPDLGWRERQAAADAARGPTS